MTTLNNNIRGHSFLYHDGNFHTNITFCQTLYPLPENVLENIDPPQSITVIYYHFQKAYNYPLKEIESLSPFPQYTVSTVKIKVIWMTHFEDKNSILYFCMFS